ncbi:MAG: serine protease [Steroidobacteraceae bacterium]
MSLESARIHPAYAPFAEAWEKYEPLAIEASGAAQPREFVPGYDVAILNVAEGATLGPPLRRAGLAKLETLQSGMPVSFIGFPLENLVARDLARPAAESQTASLVGFTTFTRMQPVEGDGQLIEHSLPATGGASGSPIFDAEGEVIAILSGGNVMMAEEARLPNAALVNFAQRIDVIEPLLAATGGFDLDAARARWQVDLAHYDNPETEATRVLEARLQDWRKRIGAKVEPQPVLQETLTISTDDRIEDLFAVVRRVDGAGAGHYLVSVRGLVRHDFDALAVQLPSQRASADGGAGAGTGAGSGEADADRKSRELARDASHSAYATLSFDLDGDGGFSLLVADSSLRAGGAPARCELTVYHLPR